MAGHNNDNYPGRAGDEPHRGATQHPAKVEEADLASGRLADEAGQEEWRDQHHGGAAAQPLAQEPSQDAGQEGGERLEAGWNEALSH